MKKIILSAAMLLVAGAALLTSCSKEEGQVFNLSIADHSKTTLGENHRTNWQDGDVIYVNGNNALTVTTDGASAHAYSQNDITIDPVNNQYFAFYGGSRTETPVCNVTESAQSFTFTAPTQFDYSAVNLHSPMAGIGAAGNHVTILFHNLFTMLEFEVPIANATSGYDIIITETDDVNNQPLSGTFTTTYEDGEWNTECTDNAGYSLTVHKNSGETRVCIPIPAGAHNLDIYINAGYKAHMVQNYSFKPGYYYNVTTKKDLPQEVIPWPFPYDDSTVFFFGKGNLCYHETENPSWRLETNQWDTTNYVANVPNHRQTSQVVWQIADSLNPTSLNNGGAVTGLAASQAYARLIDAEHLLNWVLPTRDHWSFALGTAPGMTPRWAYCRISYTNKGSQKTANGLIIVPSGADISGTGITLAQTYSNWTSAPLITSTQFETLERQGCIFLPAFGMVKHQGNTGVYQNDGNGYYRTADALNPGSGSKTYVLYFTPTAAPTFNGNTQYGEGIAVRLLYIEIEHSTSSSSK